MHRFHIDGTLASTGSLTLTGDVAHRIRRVLRLTAGDAIQIFDDAGQEAVAVIDGVTPAAVALLLVNLRRLEGVGKPVSKPVEEAVDP